MTLWYSETILYVDPNDRHTCGLEVLYVHEVCLHWQLLLWFEKEESIEGPWQALGVFYAYKTMSYEAPQGPERARESSIYGVYYLHID